MTLSKTLSVSRVLTVWLAAVLLGAGWGTPAALSAEPDPAVYYGWLDAYQNPGAATPPVPLPDTLPADQQVPDSAAAGSEEPLVAQAEAGQGLKRKRVNFLRADGRHVSSLGCYYHRSYYSHLPLFQDGAYTLPGSLDVAEPYQQLSRQAISSPAGP
ncbi:MAG: hypothetical protein J4F42_13610 [Desulfurellaceae bacterium]|nr:hypothetical protein [Desulfurellaceae bacterium]